MKNPSLKPLALAIALLFAGPVLAVSPTALPTGEQVSQGQATFARSGSTLAVHQASQNAEIRWQSFDIGSQARVAFQQPNASAIAVNRILGVNGSQIMGQLSANGQVFLINPNGILFGRGAQVDVGGLVASTLDLAQADYSAGRFVFQGSGGRVENQGRVNAGRLLLLGGEAVNSGALNAPGGSIELAAGGRATLTLDGAQLFQLKLDEGVARALVSNSGSIQAANGVVRLSAKAVDTALGAVVNNEGLMEARGLSREGGEIVLAAETGQVQAGGVLDVSSDTGRGGRVALSGEVVYQTGSVLADGSSGGGIEVAADRLLHAGQLSARGRQTRGGDITLTAGTTLVETSSARMDAGGAGQGGRVALDAGSGTAMLSGELAATGAQGGSIHVTGRDITLAAARLDAGGRAGGGEILVGGDAHGANPAVPNAQRVLVNDASRLTASAGETGSGGSIVVWSDHQTVFGGTARAEGGARGGDGGFIEISGKGDWSYGGTASAAAPAGRAGTVLFDPKNIVVDAAAPWSGVSYLPLANPNLASSNAHGNGGAAVLSNGNIAVASPYDNFGAAGAGAAYLYNGSTGALISALYGSSLNDNVGRGTAVGAYNGVVALTNGNFVVNSPGWGASVGAVTWASGVTGVSGTVSGANSLVGSGSNRIGSGGITALNNGNYVVSSPTWAFGGLSNAGAVTWVNGANGQTANSSNAVSAANSLIGSHASDRVGQAATGAGVIALSNGHYAVTSSSWNGFFGAATWGNGASGTVGILSAANSLVGTSANDYVGYYGSTALMNGNFVVGSWNAGKGAVTWMDGASLPAVANRTVNNVANISAANSLVGTLATDALGVGGITALSNGNYVVSSLQWSNNLGAATWGNGAGGTVGAVSAANSLVGRAGDQFVGRYVKALSNGNYVVISPNALSQDGAVTWVDGSTANGGKTVNNSNNVSAANSLVGGFTIGMARDNVGNGGVVELANGNYVVISPYWSDGTFSTSGAVTWAAGDGSTVGPVSVANSLTGSFPDDRVGMTSNGWVSMSAFGTPAVTALSNGHYVVSSGVWRQGLGAVTWRNGTGAFPDTVSAANSLTGTSFTDQIGWYGTKAVGNGNFVVASPNWNGDTGAATWMEGALVPVNANRTLDNLGTVSAANSLVGSAPGDLVGITAVAGVDGNGVTRLSNGDYALTSLYWNGSRGAVTWGAGNAGLAGVVSAANSLTGSAVNDLVGKGGIRPLAGGMFVVNSHGMSSPNGLVSLSQPGGSLSNPFLYNDSPAATANLLPSQLVSLLAGGSAVTLQASNDITINSAITVPGAAGGSLNLHAGRSVLVNANLNTANGAVEIIANDTAAHGVVDAQRDAGNAVITLAPGTGINAGSGPVNITLDTGAGNSNSGSGAITLGSITAGAITVVNRGPSVGSDIVLPAGASLVTGAGGEIRLAAAGAGGSTFSNQAGAGGLNPGAGGRYLVWSDNPANTTEGLAGYAKHYNQTYGGAAPAYAAAGNWFLYRMAPTLTVTPNGGVGKVYDGNGTSLGAAAPTVAGVAGLIDGDTLTLGAATWGAATGAGIAMTGNVAFSRAAGKNLGNYDLHANAAISANDLGYLLAQGTAANGFAITPRALTVSGLAGNDKVYDGGLGATVNTAGAVFTGLVAGDALGFSASGSFLDKAVANGKPVTLTSNYLGADAGNYAITSQAATMANITAKPLTVAGGFTAADRVYDGSTAASFTGNGLTLAGILAGDTVSGNFVPAFGDKNAGLAKPVTLGSGTLAGLDAGNYSLSLAGAPTALARISPATLTVGGSFGANNKTWDGTPAATFAANNLVILGLAPGDAISGSLRPTFADSLTGTGKPVSLSFGGLAGVDAANYALNLAGAPAALADILPAAAGSGAAAWLAPSPPASPSAQTLAQSGQLLAYGADVLSGGPSGPDKPAPGDAPGYALGAPDDALSGGSLYQLRDGGLALPDNLAP